MLLINTTPPTDPWSYKQQKPQLFDCFAISLTNQWYVPAFAYSRWLTKCKAVEFWLEQIDRYQQSGKLSPGAAYATPEPNQV
jgi:hypothetical protein